MKQKMEDLEKENMDIIERLSRVQQENLTLKKDATQDKIIIKSLKEDN